MANFSTDSDLLAREPGVFAELPFAGQTKLRVTDANISGSTVTSTTGGFNRLSAGDAVLFGEAAFAIAAIVNNNTLTLAAIPSGVTGGTMYVRTFAPQARLVHQELMRVIGIDTDDPDQALGESAIVSVSLMKDLEVLGTLARAYTAAITLTGGTRAVKDKAERYGRLFVRSLLGAAVLIDLDGDGYPDVTRFPGVGEMTRA
jgi:hypothetical protein